MTIPSHQEAAMHRTRKRNRRLVAGLAIALLGAGAPIMAREPSVATGDLVPARFEALALLPGGEGAAVALAVGAAGGRTPERLVAIFIGPVEAAAIGRARDGNRPVRPQTHELLVDLVVAAGLQARRLVIDELRGSVYLATVEFQTAEGEVLWVDARPSDGLVLALRLGLAIQLGPSVLASAPDWDDIEPAAEPLPQTPVTL
ncbi:MAG: bifunctional nuclease family protein [Xanthomonadales bacterium]|nr:bifunctional nuclease family protein [Xanthomonadales bacterium]